MSIRDTESFPHLAPFDSTDSLVLTPAPNGGYIVSKWDQEYNERQFSPMLGAFSSPTVMLVALTAALTP